MSFEVNLTDSIHEHFFDICHTSIDIKLFTACRNIGNAIFFLEKMKDDPNTVFDTPLIEESTWT